MREQAKMALQSAVAEREFAPRPCFTCGTGTIAVRNAEGQELPHRSRTSVRINTPLFVPMCDTCGEMLLNGEDIDKLDAALDASA